MLQFNIPSKISVSTPISTIKNLNMNGNALTMWQPSDDYAQEQASLILFSAENKTNNSEAKLRFNIENCTFENNVSDGLHIRSNIDCNIHNCKSHNCFRGGLTITGGNAIINVDNFIFRSDEDSGMPDGIDIEVDGSGYGSDNSIIANLSNINIDIDCDLGISGNSKVIVKNLTTNRGGIFINIGSSYKEHNTKLILENCNFLGNTGSYYYRSLGNGGDTTFKNCTFNGTNRFSLNNIYNKNQSTLRNKLTFVNCVFNNPGISGGWVNCEEHYYYNCYFNTGEEDCFRNQTASYNPYI